MLGARERLFFHVGPRLNCICNTVIKILGQSNLLGELSINYTPHLTQYTIFISNLKPDINQGLQQSIINQVQALHRGSDCKFSYADPPNTAKQYQLKDNRLNILHAN